MKLPSDEQARLLRLVTEQEETVEWLTNAENTYWRGHRPSFARLLVERIDRERNTARFSPVVATFAEEFRLTTVRACIKAAWLDGDERTCEVPTWRYGRSFRERVQDSQTFWLRALDLTEDGRIALGVWSERKLNADPAPLPELDDRQREIVQLAQRALELGYALCAREPARVEARRMRKDGWWRGCWVANSATGLVPTSLAIAEALPERADEPMTPVERTYSPFNAAVEGPGDQDGR